MKDEAERRRKAKENVERNFGKPSEKVDWQRVTIEQQARAAAKWLNMAEENWETLIPLLIEIEYGRLTAIGMEHATPEWQEGFRNYMQNR